MNTSKKDFIEYLTASDTGVEICESPRLEDGQFQRIWGLVSVTVKRRFQVIVCDLSRFVDDREVVMKAARPQLFNESFMVLPSIAKKQCQNPLNA